MKALHVVFFIFCFTSVFSQDISFNVRENIDILSTYYSKGKILKLEDGLTDVENTLAIQEFINENNIVIFPNKEYIINDIGLTIPSNRIIIFNKGSKLTLSASNKVGYELLRLHSVENVVIYNPQLSGDKYTHLDNKGQWGFGISIRDSKNILVKKGYIEKMWGDAIYVGQVNDQPASNVLIDQVHINDNRRNGISITSGTDITIQNSLIENTKGQSPQCAIDIEPNTTKDVISNILIENNKTVNNYFAGILIMLDQFKKEDIEKYVTIDIVNHSNENSNYGIAFYGFKKSIFKNMSGLIKIENFFSSQYKSEKYYYPETNMSNIKTLWK